MQKIINIELLLGMTSTTYCYRRSEPSDDEDEHHIDRVVVDGEDEDDDKHVLKS
jgi:hypothetical protein